MSAIHLRDSIKGAQIIDEALIQYEIKTIIYCYKSIWEEFESQEVNFYVGFDEDLMKLKLKALREYKSQLKNPELNPKDKPLESRIQERDRRMAELLNLDTAYAEGFFRTESL